MRILQARPTDPAAAIARAREMGCGTIAWDIAHPCDDAVGAAARVGLASEAWLQAARDPEAAAAHPEWMHAPQHHEWLRRFPDWRGGHPALVAPYIGLGTAPAFAHAAARVRRLLAANPWAQRLWLADVQGPPMGCGCGNPSCRSWDNAPGEKVAPSAYDVPEVLFPLAFWQEVRRGTPQVAVVPVLCPECERGVTIDGVDDPDGPDGTDLCQGIPCVRPCAQDYWPRLLAAFRAQASPVALLLLTDALGKNHPVYGAARAWPRRARAHYAPDAVPCVEPADADGFTACLIATDAPQDCFPVAPPAGYAPSVPAIQCGWCPPE